MSQKHIITILGGDRRQISVAKRLLDLGHTVRIFGLGEFSLDISGADIFLSLEKAVQGCDMILLPLPVSRDKISLNLSTVEKKEPVMLADIVKLASKNTSTIILGGMVPDIMMECASRLGVEIVDYYIHADLQQKNALPSAEGAIMTAMENCDRVIEGMHIFISGYGRIGKILARKLKALGAYVYVAARRDEVLCEIALSGYKAVRIIDAKEVSDVVSKCDIIFNTVPYVVFNRPIIEKVKHRPLYLEIASSPGGIDIFAARAQDIRIIFAPSLPGKYAPASAGEYIFEAIREISSERGIIL